MKKEKKNNNRIKIIKKKKIKKLSLNILIILICFFILETNNVYASSPKMITKIYDSFSKIQKYITRISTPIAGVSFGTGFLMRKFSFGDEERVRKSKKLIRDTAVAYSLILCLDLILSLIETLAG